jgi:hypothetical protein
VLKERFVTASENLLPFLLPDQISGMDLLQVLLQHYGGAVHTGGREVLYPKDLPHALRVVFNNRGKLIDVQAAEAMTPESLRSLRERIHREFVESAGLGVNRQVYFCMAPVRGWWRYRDLFQILPVPESAPKADFAFLDHPFLIEFRYTRAPDFFLDSCRRARTVSKLALLLNALLVSPVQPLGNRSPGNLRFAWVMMPPEKGDTEPKIAYRQEGYHYDGICNPAEDFCPVGHLEPIAAILPQDYYRGEHRSIDKELKIPSDLTESLDHFYALAPCVQDRFLNACYWLSQANYASSLSMTFLAAIQAIETLVDPATGGTKCAQCGHTKRPGPTHQFAAFLKRYLQCGNGGDDACRLLYEIRSGLTHGYDPPFLADMEIVGMLNPAADKQRQCLTLALTSARVVFRNWLRDEARLSS